LQNVFQEVRISEQLDDAALYQFATVVNQYPRPNSDDYAEIFDELLDRPQVRKDRSRDYNSSSYR